MSKNTLKTASPSHALSPAKLRATQQELDRLAEEFTEYSAILRAAPSNLAMVAELRARMRRAGEILCVLVRHRVIAGPLRLPPWLSWRTRGIARPRFRAMIGRPFHSNWSPARTVRGLVQVLRSGPEAVDTETPRRPGEDDSPAFIRRHLWVEAISGWLGQRCTPRLQVVVPPVQVVLDTNGLQPAEVTPISIVFDWVADTTQQHLLFLELGRDSAAACRHLFAELGRQMTNPTAPSATPSILSTHDALDDLRDDISHGSGAAGREAHEQLFGPRHLHDELLAVAQRREEYKRRFRSHTRMERIADFVVASGHEALAILADRVVKRAGGRSKSIPRALAALESARATGDAARIAVCEIELESVGQDFAKAMENALNGWNEHRAWIRRCIEQESLQSDEVTAGTITHEPSRAPAGLGAESWDPRRAFHEAVLAVYEDLGALVRVVTTEASRDVALYHLYAVVELPTAPEPGDLPLTANLKHAVGQLRSSLATVYDIRKVDHGVGRAFWRGVAVDRFWAGIGSGSHHEVALGAANVMLEPPWDPDTMRRQVLDAAGDHEAWARLASNMRHEFRLASLMPPEARERDEATDANIRGEPVATPTASPTPADDLFRGTSKAAVVAIVRAVSMLRTDNGTLVLNAKGIKARAGRKGGAGDVAVRRAIELGFVTDDYHMTSKGRLLINEP